MKAATENSHSYAPVQHADHVAVHAAEYAPDGTLVSVDEKPQELKDLNLEHLTNFIAHVAVGITNKKLITAAEFAAKVKKA